MSITIKLSNGTQKTIEVPDLGINVAQLKDIASSSIGIPADEQRVVLRGRVLKDADVLSSIGLEHGQAVHIVRGQKSAKLSSTTPTQPTTSSEDESSTPSNTTAQTGSESTNPYMALLGNLNASSSNAGNSINAQPVNQGVGGGWPLHSQDMTAQMMQNPVFMQMVQEAMRNPQLMQQLIQMSMQGQGVNNEMGMGGTPVSPALMQQSMQLMNDPGFMQQILQMMGNNPGLPFLGQPNSQQNIRAASGTSQQAQSGINFTQSQGDPRVIYQSQLQQLREMGFPNEEANITALQQSQGNLSFAIERLLNA